MEDNGRVGEGIRLTLHSFDFIECIYTKKVGDISARLHVFRGDEWSPKRGRGAFV